MQELEKMLEQEMKQLEEKIRILEQRLARYPEGILILGSSGGYTQYYYRDGKGYKHYLKKEQREFAQLLAQKDYDDKLLGNLKTKHHYVKKCYNQYKEKSVMEIYEKLHHSRKNLVEPIYVSDHEYAKQWQDVSWQRKPFAEGVPEIYTVKGERVRSKSEKILADYFEREGIPYRYEYPVRLSGSKIIHPDFMLLNIHTRKEYYLEHLGQMDNPEYAANAVSRIEEMARNGIVQGNNLLLTAETSKHTLNMGYVQKLIEENIR